ncbi:MAG: TonB C-terminal domain-containing protein [Acidobacteriia bacterium]|nr:TonB C-terminal domain-containing protein [Terriglobia bacterium]
MGAEPQLRLLVELEGEAARWRRRTMFLLSVVLHGLMILLLMVSPGLFRRGAAMLGIQLQPQPSRETTMLWFPPDLLRRLQEPPPDTDTLSDRNRQAQGRSPVIDPHGLRMPYSRGNTPLPEIAGGGSPPPPPALPPPGAGSAPSAGRPSTPPPPKPESNQEAQLRLMDVPPPGSGGNSGLRVPLSSPGEAIQQSLEEAARGRAGGPGEGPGDSSLQFRNYDPNFSTEAPLILSDTRGVDFGPYLARVVYNVRRNWYSMIPVAAKLGQKGRVGIIFEIVKDGSVPQLRLVASSGLDPLDRAAIGAIRAANPFPPLPPEFTGEHLVLQFIFLYNLGYIP